MLLSSKHPVGIYLLKVNNTNNGTRCEICSKLTMKTERHHWRRSGVFIVNFERVNVDWAVSVWVKLSGSNSVQVTSFSTKILFIIKILLV